MRFVESLVRFVKSEQSIKPQKDVSNCMECGYHTLRTSVGNPVAISCDRTGLGMCYTLENAKKKQEWCPLDHI